MADICKENNVIIIADEIHGDLIRQDSTFVPIVKTTDKTDHIISCTAINKTFNVAGLHATNIIIENKELRARFKKVLGMAMATPFTINAVITAYTECSEWLDQIKTYLDGTIDWVMAFLKDKMPRVKFQRPEGTYIFWMDFNGYNISVEEIKQRIYTNANVVLELKIESNLSPTGSSNFSGEFGALGWQTPLFCQFQFERYPTHRVQLK